MVDGVAEPALSQCAQHPAPIRPLERIDTIDVLRGLALFGVLTVNLITEFRVSVFQQFLPRDESLPLLDRLVETFVSVGLELKAFALFSLLFGVGLAIQFERLAPDLRLRLLVRRLAVLLAFGLIHLCLIWNGDILTEYALAGFLVLPFLFLPNWGLATASLILLGVFASLSSLLTPAFWPSHAWLQQHVVEANRVYSLGTHSDILRFNMREALDLVFLHEYIFPRTLALFLMGVLAWRTGLLRNPDQHKRFLLCMAFMGLAIGMALSIPGVPENFPAWNTLAPFLVPIGPVVLALGYGTAIVSLVAFTRARRVLGMFGPLGRMAFTNYLLQSLIFSWIFFGYGLGYFGRLGATETMALGLVVYVAQLIGSAWWLRRYRFGPVEWLWRTLMYGTRQPMALIQWGRSEA